MGIVKHIQQVNTNAHINIKIIPNGSMNKIGKHNRAVHGEEITRKTNSNPMNVIINPSSKVIIAHGSAWNTSMAISLKEKPTVKRLDNQSNTVASINVSIAIITETNNATHILHGKNGINTKNTT